MYVGSAAVRPCEFPRCKRTAFHFTLDESVFFSSRFYSKFHKRRMEELNSTGLHQFISLFLTLSCVADLEDVVRCEDVFVLLYHRQNGLRSL